MFRGLIVGDHQKESGSDGPHGGNTHKNKAIARGQMTGVGENGWGMPLGGPPPLVAAEV